MALDRNGVTAGHTKGMSRKRPAGGEFRTTCQPAVNPARPITVTRQCLAAEAVTASMATISDVFEQPAIRDIFAQADQDRVQADLAAFCGPRADVYLRVYREMREGSGQRAMSWSWAGFFVPSLWLFYRKLYLLGTLCLLLPVFVAFGPDAEASAVAASISLVVAIWAKAWYVSTGLRRIAEADRLELAGTERHNFLRHMGGVSPTAGWLVAFLHAAILLIAIGWGVANSPPLLFQTDADLMRHGSRLQAPR